MSLPHNLRLRPDLIIQPQDPAGGTWVVKDPVALRFFLFGGDEQFVMARLDGRSTLADIIGEFERERAPKRMTLERLQAFLTTLHRNGLACSDAPRQGHIMLERAAEQRWRESVLGWTNLLAIRLLGVNPTAALDRIYAWTRWGFSWWFLACATVVCALALSVVVTDWQVFRTEWPRLQEFVSGRNLLWLGVALVATKCLHEMAHALTCKHFGGSCHEMGIMLLVFVPCLYCNVTDAWMLRSRGQRIAISAAGMLMEFFLAALAVLLWRYTHTGLLNSICLNVIVVCSVSTLLFNGNPLLKHDAYYILSDVLRMPNLWQQSRAYLYRCLGKWFLTHQPRDEMPPDHPWFLLSYAVASSLYRIGLTVGILLFMYRALQPRGLDLVVLVVAVSVIGQSLYMWSRPVLSWSRNPARLKRINKRAPITLGVLAVLLGAGVLLVPFPASVTAPAVLQPRAAVQVFVTSPGVLVDQSVVPGAHVEQGQTLAVLENAELRNQRLFAASELTRSQARVRTLQMRLNDEREAAAQLAVAQEIVNDFSEQVRLRDKEFRLLTIVAPLAGTVLEPPGLPSQVGDENELPTWSGSPLAPENRGCYLERGTLLCLIGDPHQYEATVLIDETDMPYVKTGQAVRLQVAHAPAVLLAGHVVEIAEVNADIAPPELVSQHAIAVDPTRSRNPKPLRTVYQARVEVDQADLPLVAGARGTVRIQVAPQTVAEKLLRWARHTFALEPKS